jgi:hypothetical protein
MLPESKASECRSLLKISVCEARHKRFRGLSRAYAAYRGYNSLSNEIMWRPHYILSLEWSGKLSSPDPALNNSINVAPKVCYPPIVEKA